MTQAFFDHPYLSGHHEPVRFEATAPDLIVDGEIPKDLAGVFYRNGPEPLYPTREGDYHWFDGDGMVYAFEIEDGRVSMRNRWVRTEKFTMEKAAGKRLFGMFGNPMTADPSAQGKIYNTANTNIILHGGKLMALMEGAKPVVMGPRAGRYGTPGSVVLPQRAMIATALSWATGVDFRGAYSNPGA